MMKNNFKKGLFGKATAKWGFTVLETIISIAVVSLAISGAFAAVRTGLFSASLAKEETRAYQFAQEAVEMLRNKRDSNLLASLSGSSATWLTGIAAGATDPCYFGKTCYADAYTNTFTACSGGWGTCPYLNQDQTTYLYGYAPGWTVTTYKREIQIESVNADQVFVTVRVSWDHSGTTREFKTKTLLTNWF